MIKKIAGILLILGVLITCSVAEMTMLVMSGWLNVIVGATNTLAIFATFKLAIEWIHDEEESG